MSNSTNFNYGGQCGRRLLEFLILLVMERVTECSQERPHIIFILADDLGWNDVSFHGSRQIPTPNIDLLASDGVVLHNYYVSPICTPSRGSLMTGKHPIRLGLQHDVIYAPQPWGLHLNETILPQHLKNLGYSTHMVGKWHLGLFKNDYLPQNRGFDSSFGYWNGKKDYYTHVEQAGTMSGLDLHDGFRPAWNYFGKYATDIFTEKAEKIIHNRDLSKPLFLYLSHQAVHAGNADAPLQPPPNCKSNFSYIADEARRKFAGMVSALDISVGKIFKAMNEAGILNKTILIFSTDNGAAVEGIDLSTGSNYPLRGSKYNMFEGGIRGISFIWSSVLRKRSRVSKEMMHISDWLPTLIAAAGGNISALDDIDGMNQWECILHNRSCLRNEILHNIDPVWKVKGVRRNNFKLLQGTVFGDRFNGWFDKNGKKTSNYTEIRPDDYQKLLTTSETATILNVKYGLSFPSLFNRAIDLATSTAVHCGEMTKNASTDCRPNHSACLFNVLEDPCEYRNLAGKKTEVVKKLKRLLNKYESKMVPVANKPGEDAANPKYHNYVWDPWKS